MASDGTEAAASGDRSRRLFVALFFLSGAAGLADQVVWLRYLSLVFGNTTLATATLVAVFLGGLGAGAWWFAHRLARGRFSRITLYALLEAGIGLFAVVSPRFFDWMDSAYVAVYRGAGDIPWAFALLRVVLAVICLLPPTFLMGGTLPVLLDGIREGRAGSDGRGGRGREGADTALFYGANTLGAVFGVAAAGFFTIRLVGLHATLLLSASANFAVALLAMLFGGRRPAVAPPGDAIAPRGERVPFLLLVAAATGAASIACEVLWTRILVFYLGSSVYAFSLMLLLFLLGIALGSFAAGRVVDRIARPLRALAWTQVALAATVPLVVALFASTNERQIALSESLEPQRFATVLLAQLLAIAPILLPPTLLMGFAFPLLVRAHTRGGSSLGRDLGEIYGANTAGSIVGALAAGFVLVPAMGSQSSLFFAGGVSAVVALALARRDRLENGALDGPRSRALPAAAPAALAAIAVLLGLGAAALLVPSDRVILAAGLFARDRPGDLVEFHEDATAAVAVRRKVEAGRPWLSLELNGVNVAGTSPDLYAVQKMQGHLPLLLSAFESPRVVHIGFGSGGTAHAVSRHPVKEIRIVEISPAVLAASDRYFADLNAGVLHDPRVKVEINDGRNFLLATPEKFEAVLSDSIHPRYAGNGSLYSEEYFRLVDARLVPDGVVSMWLPMYSLSPANFAMILRAFVDVFPQAAVWYEPSALNSFTVVTARKGDSPWDGEAIARGFARPAVAEALADIGLRSPSDLLAGVVVSGEPLMRYLDGVPPHVDDLPAVEYESGAILAGNWSWRQNFERLLDFRPAEAPADIVAALPEGERAGFAELWRIRGARLAEHRAYLASQVSRWQ